MQDGGNYVPNFSLIFQAQCMSMWVPMGLSAITAQILPINAAVYISGKLEEYVCPNGFICYYRSDTASQCCCVYFRQTGGVCVSQWVYTLLPLLLQVRPEACAVADGPAVL